MQRGTAVRICQAGRHGAWVKSRHGRMLVMDWGKGNDNM